MLEDIWVIVIIFVLAFSLLLWFCLALSGRYSRAEEQRDLVKKIEEWNHEHAEEG